MENFDSDSGNENMSSDEEQPLLEPYPETRNELKSLGYYLSQLDIYMDEYYGWVFAFHQWNDRILQILNDYFRFDSWDAMAMLKPDEEANRRLQLEEHLHIQWMENQE